MKTVIPLFALLTLLALTFGAANVAPAYAAGAIVVNSASDTIADDGACTLSEAITNAIGDSQLYATSGECAAGSGDDTITFNPALSGATIYLQSVLTLSSNITIDGSGLSSQVSISGDSNVQVFSVSSGTVTLNSLTITNGSVSSVPGGGGIYNQSGATLTITNSTLSGNTNSNGPGGGIRNDGMLTVTNSTFSGNTASASGGGIRNIGALTVTNSTFSGNSATSGSGGGIYNVAGFISATITNSTFSSNSAGSAGGGIYYSTGTFNYANTIIANSTSGGDCAGDGTMGTNTNNLVEDGGCSASLTGDPSLTSLAANGGPSQTFALPTGSSAVDAGDDTTCANAPVSNLDQRGIARPVGVHCDIGAYEHEPIVTKLTDTNDGVCDSDCSIKEAIAAANAGSTVTFDSSLSGGTIHLASTLTIAQNMTIDGSALASKIIFSGDSDNDGTGNVRVFVIHSGMTVTLDSLMITKGAAAADGGGIYNDTGNNSGAALTVINSIISDNSVTGNGGGILNSAGSTLTIINSTISGNSATGNGGGILSDGNLLAITDSTLSGNSAAGDGGGVRNGNIMTLTNSTISGNSASGSGGGIRNAGSLTAKNNTLSGNSASVSGGGIYSDNTFNASNNIIANSASGGDCTGEIDANTDNLMEDGSCSANVSGDPGLGPLADNGGFTQTLALLPGSPAIDQGNNSDCPATDQRSYARPADGDGNGSAICDIGAYEAEYVLLPTSTLTPIKTFTPIVAQTFTQTVTRTLTRTLTRTSTYTLTRTSTYTPTPTLTLTLTLTLTRTRTPTYTPTPTPTLTRTPTRTPVIVTLTLKSAGAQDGWVLESSETSNVGGTLNSAAATFHLGDNAQKKQYRGILSFRTGSLPDNAVITGVTLKVMKQAIIGGGNPVAIFGGFMVDIKNGFFGAAALQTGDFQAAGSAYGPFSPAPLGNWYSINLIGAKSYVNTGTTGSGLTQIRLRFKLDDNNNAIANYLNLYSGNTTTAANRPQLVIAYYVP